MIKICRTIKTLILEFVAGNGPCHIRQIHLQICHIKPQVPQHTIRARLSELASCEDLRQRLKAFGSGFYGTYEEDKNLCSVVSYPNRGPWGDSNYRGNCSGWLVKDLILRFGCRSVFDPCEGGGTVRQVVKGINKYKRRAIVYEGRDLKRGWDVLSSTLPARQFDMIWYHPPYWDIICYSGDTRDFSMCQTLQEFEDRLNLSVERLFSILKPGGVLAVLSATREKMDSTTRFLKPCLQNPNWECCAQLSSKSSTIAKAGQKPMGQVGF